MLVLLAALAAVPNPPCVGCVPVFYPELNGSACFRIPTIIRTHNNTLIAFSEARIGGCEDFGAHDLVLRRSVDGGTSWGPLIIAVHGRRDGETLSNPNPVEVLRGDGSRALLLLFDTMNNPGPSHHGLDQQVWSDDDGLTWGSRVDMIYDGNKGGLIGPAVALQAAGNGMLYTAARTTPGAETVHLLMSSDYGATWKRSQIGVEGLDECAIAFLTSAADGRILMNCRTRRHRRAQLEWSARGVPSNLTFPDGLPDANCQGSIVNVAGALYTSNAARLYVRARMTIKESTDMGSTWSTIRIVHNGPSGYSQLVPLDKGLGLLFEAGVVSPDETISFVKFGTQPSMQPSIEPSVAL